MTFVPSHFFFFFFSKQSMQRPGRLVCKKPTVSTEQEVHETRYQSAGKPMYLPMATALEVTVSSAPPKTESAGAVFRSFPGLPRRR